MRPHEYRTLSRATTPEAVIRAVWATHYQDDLGFLAWRDDIFHQKAIRVEEMDAVTDPWFGDIDADQYWCPHLFSRPLRRKRYAMPSPWLWSDLDRSDVRYLDPRPTIALSSSPGRFQGLWWCDEVPTEDDRRAFNRLMEGDQGGWIITKYLRIPNTKNYKYDPPRRGKLLWCDGPVHRLADIRRSFPTVIKPTSVRSNGPRRPMPRHVYLFLAREPMVIAGGCTDRSSCLRWFTCR